MALRQILSTSRSAVIVAATAMAAVVALALPASAHTPVILTDHDRVPWIAPLVADGTDPMGFYGVIEHPNDVRATQLQFTAGQSISVSILVPDLAPENTLPTAELPTVLLVDPQHKVTELTPQLRVPITDPDSGHHFLLLGNYAGTAVTGVYSIIVVGHAPERFALSTGIESEEFHGLVRGSVATEAQVDAWYSTPPS